METIEGVLGTITGTQTPWIAQCPVYKHASAEKMFTHKLRAMHLQQNKLKHFKCIYILGTGQEILAPTIRHIQTQKTEFGHCALVTWIFESIDIKQLMTVVAIRLIDDLGVLVMKRVFPTAVFCVPSNVLTQLDFTLALS